MEKQFENVEEEFTRLKREFRLGKISRREFIEQLKKLRLKDEEGRFWMIGAQSGKWYFFDGKNWVQSEPPSLEEGKAICIHCGFENKLEAEVCARCGENLKEKQDFCPQCGHKLEETFLECPYCSKEKEGEEAIKGEALEKDKRPYSVFRSLSPISFLFFMGVTGIFIGILFGAFAGTMDFSYKIVRIMPAFFSELHGTVVGGIIYAILGGILGFLVFSLIGFLAALIINLISSFVGGIKVHLE